MIKLEELFELVRNRTGFLVIFAMMLPYAVQIIELNDGTPAFVFISLIGVVVGVIVFEGITFDMQFVGLGLFTSGFYWLIGLIFCALNIMMIRVLWLYSEDRKKRNEVIVAALYFSAIPLFLGGVMGLFPLPFVAGAVIIKLFAENNLPPVIVESDIEPDEKIHGQVTISEHETIASIESESASVEGLPIATAPMPEKEFDETMVRESPTFSERLPRFFVHGLAFSLIDLVFSLLWPIVLGTSIATGSILGNVILLNLLAFSMAVSLIGIGLINAWISERVWHINWNYGLGSLLFSGIILFAVTQILIKPFSALAGIFLESSLLLVGIIIFIRYGVLSIFIGMLGYLLGDYLQRRKGADY
ncbi:MAG: hypothetical protein K9W43_14035 [Candidatus Thorarchaeota archaeon]|nr:hypothetical protein [Candidatus Thorarchaeota archaeon]